MDIYKSVIGLMLLTISQIALGAQIGSRSDETGGSGYRPELEIQSFTSQLKVSDDQALKLVEQTVQLLSGCGEPGGAGVAYSAITIDLDGFYSIVTKANWLPPKLNQDTYQQNILGVDADNDCVRDDIEHYIAKKYSAAKFEKVRNYLFEYAVWLNQFLVSNITQDHAKTVYRNLYLSAECVIQELGSSYTTDELFDDLFAEFHDTWPRSDRYVENGNQVSGWVTRENLSVNCD